MTSMLRRSKKAFEAINPLRNQTVKKQASIDENNSDIDLNESRRKDNKGGKKGGKSPRSSSPSITPINSTTGLSRSTSDSLRRSDVIPRSASGSSISAATPDPVGAPASPKPLAASPRQIDMPIARRVQHRCSRGCLR